MSISGLKDIDREILKHVDDKELLQICTLNLKTWNEVCDDNFLRRRLGKYPGIAKYKQYKETWKRFFLRIMYYINKMREDYNFEYVSGDFRNQYQILKFSKNLNYLLIHASRDGELSLVKHAIKHGADIHTGDDYSLIVASTGNHIPVIKYLIEHGANVHGRNDEALQRATAKGNFEVVKYLSSAK